MKSTGLLKEKLMVIVSADCFGRTWIILYHCVMLQGKLSEVWANVTKAAIAEAILNLTKLDAKHRGPDVCPTTPTVSCFSLPFRHASWYEIMRELYGA